MELAVVQEEIRAACWSGWVEVMKGYQMKGNAKPWLLPDCRSIDRPDSRAGGPRLESSCSREGVD
jgi:hypothetical protein